MPGFFFQTLKLLLESLFKRPAPFGIDDILFFSGIGLEIKYFPGPFVILGFNILKLIR